MAYVRLSHVIQPSYLLLEEALLKRFEPSSKETLYKIEFNGCNKKENETWGDLGDHILLLASRAFPSLEREVHEELALWKYLDQLSTPQLSLAVRQQHPTTINEVISCTMEVESYLVQLPVSKEGQWHLANSAQIMESDVVRTLQQLIKRVEQLELNITENFYSTQVTQVTCYHCGPIIKECDQSRGIDDNPTLQEEKQVRFSPELNVTLNTITRFQAIPCYAIYMGELYHF